MRINIYSISFMVLVMFSACTKNIKPSDIQDENAKLKRENVLLEQTLEEDPKNYIAWVKVGNNYYDIDMPQKSITAYENALSISAGDPNVWCDLAAMYRRVGKYDMAVKGMKKALTIAPDHPQCNVNLGTSYYYDYKDYDKAEKYFKKYLNQPVRLNEELDSQIKERLEEINRLKGNSSNKAL